MEILDVLRELEDFEALMCQIYRRYADQLNGNPKAEAFFRTLSRQEMGHRDFIQQTREMAGRKLQLDGITAPLNKADVQESIQTVMDHVLGVPTDDLAEMLTRAYWAEQFALEKHGALLLAGVPPLSNLLKLLRGEDEDHTAAIQRFAREQGIAVGEDCAGPPAPRG